MNILDFTYDKFANGECDLLDAHCHVKRTQDFKLICFGLLPSGYKFDVLSQDENIQVGLGFHPYAATDLTAASGTPSDPISAELQVFEQTLREVQFVGEVGLDFGDKHIATRDTQVEIFTKICDLLAGTKGKAVSIHTVKSATEVMDILEASCAANGNTIIMHWFSGSSEELKRALDSGFYFSVGPKMLATNKGYEYIRQIPEDRMFIETDLPWDGEEVTPEEHLNLLNDFAMELRNLKTPL